MSDMAVEFALRCNGILYKQRVSLNGWVSIREFQEEREEDSTERTVSINSYKREHFTQYGT